MNILHAGFPAGLVLGALLGVLLQGKRWELILLTYLVPTVLYGVLMFGQKFPASQAKVHHLSLGDMLKEFTSPVLLLLLLLMAMVGFVELGTDSWISNITGNLLLPNFSLAGFWWHNFFPGAIREVLTERLDMVPVNKQVGFFSDAYVAEWSYAKALLVRKQMVGVLAEKIALGQYSFEDALNVAREILYETPQTLVRMTPVRGQAKQLPLQMQ
jgi:hypothetical protein